MIKSYEALATCFDFNDGGADGPYALFSIGDKNMRVVVHMSEEELRKIIPAPRCRLSIHIDTTNKEDERDKLREQLRHETARVESSVCLTVASSTEIDSTGPPSNPYD